jgi:site-specific DNA recombinase
MQETIIAASYERVSTRMQGQHGFSLGHQHQTLEDFTRNQGWILPEHLRFRDGENEDASGADWDLPDLTRMLEFARKKEFHVLVVPDFDRFARSLVKGLVLEEQLKKYGVRVVYQRVPVEDSAEGRLLKNQLYSFAEYEREKITLRTTMGRRRKAQVGQVVGAGNAPYGYRFTYTLRNNQRVANSLEIDEATAPIARRIFRELRTRSSYEVADTFNAEGIPSPGGRRWQYRTIHRIGTSPVYVGTWVFGKNGRRVTPEDATGICVSVPAIIDRHEWDEVQQAMDHRRVARRGRMPRELDPYVVRGSLTCGYCGCNLYGYNNGGTRYYACRLHNPSTAAREGKAVCSLPEVNAAGIENELLRRLNETLLDEHNLAIGLELAQSQHAQSDQIRRDRIAALDTQLERQHKRLDNIASGFADAGNGEILKALMRQAKEIEILIQRLNAERAELASVPTDGLSPAEAEAIEAFAAEIRRGIAHATSADLRQLDELLKVRGKVYVDPDGVKLGRKHCFRIDWTAAIQLLDSASRLRNPVMQ